MVWNANYFLRKKKENQNRLLKDLYIYIYMCVCVCVCVCIDQERDREKKKVRYLFKGKLKSSWDGVIYFVDHFFDQWDPSTDGRSEWTSK